MTLAIDPGSNGGMAVGGNGAQPYAFSMPDSDFEVAREIGSIQNTFPDLTAIVEEVGGYAGGPGQPGSAMFKFGKNYGVILGVLAAYKIPTTLVRPQKWMKELGLGTREKTTSKADWKRKLKAMAQRLYPNCNPTLGTCDALLILHYATTTK